MGKKATGVFYRGTTNNSTLFKSVIFVKKKNLSIIKDFYYQLMTQVII